ncbi:MAG: hypothetical protein HFF36_06310 [Coprobacillus sp.]|nr:hypothetical protein [Coprobacillus sp.]
MFNKVQIILDKGKTKQKMFIFFDLTDTFFIMFSGLFGYGIGGLIGSLYQFVFGLCFAGVVGFLKFEFSNTFCIYDYLKLGYHYHFDSPKGYVYYPIAEIEEGEKLNKNAEEETKKIKHKRKKKKRKGKTIKE